MDLRDATPDDFMGKAVYPPPARCLVLEKSLEQLEAAAKMLRSQGFRRRLDDCDRPHHVQYAFPWVTSFRVERDDGQCDHHHHATRDE